MGSNWMGLFDLVVVLGGALGFGFWQLHSVKRDQRKREEAERAAAAKESPPGP